MPNASYLPQGMSRSYLFKPSLQRIYQDNRMSRIFVADSLSFLPYLINTEIYSIITANELQEANDLARNDLCICGSGKKSKNCHGDLNPDSILAHLLIKMKNIDFEIENKQRSIGAKSLCPKGCSYCCSDYFYVSRIEYYAIRSYILNAKPGIFDVVIKKAEEQYALLKSLLPEEYKLLSTKTKLCVKYNSSTFDQLFEDHANLESWYPCILLDEDNLCSCYPARTLICRLYGTSSQFPACNKLKRKYRRKRLEKNLIDVKYSEEQKMNIEMFVYNNVFYINNAYPLFYWFANDKSFTQDFYNATSMDIRKYNENIAKLHC